jgi:hypothetical protein
VAIALLATPEERIAVLEKYGVGTFQLYRLEGERIKRLKEEWSSYLGEMVWPGKEQGPRECDKVSSAPVARGRQSDGAFL